MADNQSVKIKATADTSKIEGKLDKLASQLDFVASKSVKTGRSGKKAGDDMAKGFGGVSGAVNGAVNSMMAMVGPAALIAALIASVKSLISYYKELEKAQAAASNKAGMTLSSVGFGTGLMNDKGGLARLQEAMKNNASLISPQQEYQIFNTVSSEDVRNEKTFDQEIALSARIADTIPKFEADPANMQKFAKDVGAVFATGAFTEDEALARGLFFNQGKGRNTDAIQGIAKMLTVENSANLTKDERREFVDSALAMNSIAAANGLRGTSASSVIDSMNNKEALKLSAQMKGEGLDEDEITRRLAAGEQEISRKAIDVINRAVKGDPLAITQIKQVSAQGEALGNVLIGDQGRTLAEMRGVNYDESIVRFQGEQTPESSLAMASAANAGELETMRSFATRAQILGTLEEQNKIAAEDSGNIVRVFDDWLSRAAFTGGAYQTYLTAAAKTGVPGLAFDAGTREEIQLRRISQARGTTPQEEFERIFGGVKPNEQMAESFPNIDINITVSSDESSNVLVEQAN